MKIDNISSSATTVGQIERNSVGIDYAQVDKMVTLLTTKLYSDPLSAFLREIVSNGWDSHVEAGVDLPVIVKIDSDPTDTNQLYIMVRDYGTGLSPERFDTIFRNLGATTKADSNEFIGAFGLGRFAALAVSPMVSLTSYYEGTKYSYVMYTDETKISIDLLGTSNTDEKNGFEVQVTYPRNSYYKVIEAIKTHLVWFENVYVEDSISNGGYFEDRLESKIIFEHFVYSVYNNSVSVVYGNCFYTLNKDSIKTESIEEREIIEKFLDGSYKFYLKFGIGELDVSPNRESLHYTEKTSKAIIKKCQQALDEFVELKLGELNGGTLTYKDVVNPPANDDLKVKDSTIRIPKIDFEVELEGVKIPYQRLLYKWEKFRHMLAFRAKRFYAGSFLTKAQEVAIEDILYGRIINFNRADYKQIELKYIRRTARACYLHENWGKFVRSFYFRRVYRRFFRGQEMWWVKIFYRALLDKADNAKSFDISGMTDTFVAQNSPKKRDTTEITVSILSKSSSSFYKRKADLVGFTVEFDRKETYIVTQEKQFSSAFLYAERDFVLLKVSQTNFNKLLKLGYKPFSSWLDTNKNLIIEHFRLNYLKDSTKTNLDKLKDEIKFKDENLEKVFKSKLQLKNYYTMVLDFREQEEIKEKTMKDPLFKDVQEISNIQKAFNIYSDLGKKYLVRELKNLNYIH